jgi:PAS domain-containing protein
MTTSSDLIYVKDRAARMIYCNPMIRSLLNASEAELYGKNDVEFLGPGSGGEKILIEDERIMSTGIGETLEEWVTWPDGTRRVC